MYFLTTLSIVLVLGFILIKYSGKIKKISKKTQGDYAQWITITFIAIFLAIIATLLTPEIYFLKWTFSIEDFITFLSLSLLLLFIEFRSIIEFSSSNPKREKEMIEGIRNSKISDLGIDMFISSAIPEELIFRYILLGLLILWNPFASLVGTAILFGIGHIFSHPERRTDELISGVAIGFVLGWAYLSTQSLILVILLHWCIDFIALFPVKYPKKAKKILIGIFVTLLISIIISWKIFIAESNFLMSIYSFTSLIWGIITGLILLIIIYLSSILGRRVKKLNN